MSCVAVQPFLCLLSSCRSGQTATVVTAHTGRLLLIWAGRKLYLDSGHIGVADLDSRRYFPLRREPAGSVVSHQSAASNFVGVDIQDKRAGSVLEQANLEGSIASDLSPIAGRLRLLSRCLCQVRCPVPALSDPYA